jgi:two-component system chemotaxis response regulator CheB
VQDPAEAPAPEMPRSAVEHASVDHVVRLAEMPRLIERLVAEPLPALPPQEQPPALGELEGNEPGAPVEIVCPQCQGALTVAELGGFQVFRCHVGHTFSLDVLAVEQAEHVERALWAAARSLEEGAAIARRARARATGDLRRKLAEKEASQLAHAELIRNILLEPRRKPGRDSVAPEGGEPGHP